MQKKILKFNFPKKSIFGFKVLNSIQSTCFAYLFILLIFLSNYLNGIYKIELLARNFYIIISNFSFIILCLNAFNKRYELNKNIYLAINLPLFGFFPLSIYLVIKFCILVFYIIFYK
tara:strand:+ start:27 stop:377 length:351 start_codon:yes stop_codon:yes gene_type:complete